MRIRRGAQGFTLVEVLVALAIITIALVALLSTVSQGSLNVYAGGGQSKATAYARQLLEQLKSQPLGPGPCTPPAPLTGCFPPADGTDTPEQGVVRQWNITQTPANIAPNRLWTITVTVGVNAQTVGGQSITLWTMRAECGTQPGQYPC